MSALIQLQATVKAPPGLTARTHRGVEFVVREVMWAAYPFGLAVTLVGEDDDGQFASATLYPDHSDDDDVSHLPHPGAWFDHLAAEIVTPAEQGTAPTWLGLTDVEFELEHRLDRGLAS